MRSTSADGVVVRDVPADSLVEVAAAHDLRNGAWTRLGTGAALGDEATESLLDRITARSHQAARAQGYATGWAEGRRIALARADEEAALVRRRGEEQLARQAAEHAQAIAALETAVRNLNELTDRTVEGIAAQTADLAFAIAEAVVAREVASAADPGAEAIRRALAETASGVDVTVRLNPEDRAALDPSLLDDTRLSVVADPSLRRGDAVAETEENVVDATLTAALVRVWEVLSR